ncbi:peptide-methionine (S)-S-oxide reductase, partial [archaeon]|nr:peptide-methionine (S)-S-oxide reductase [archaeon]
NLFWEIHDPTQLDRQGLDVGSQYKSIIFYFDEKEKEIAQKSKKEKQKEIERKIVTKIIKVKKFYEAEEYHQKYLMKRGRNTC